MLKNLFDCPWFHGIVVNAPEMDDKLLLEPAAGVYYARVASRDPESIVSIV